MSNQRDCTSSLNLYLIDISATVPLRIPWRKTGVKTKLTSFHRFINNEYVKGVDGKTFETINPTNEKPICSVHEATEKDVDIAVAAARKAFEGEWKTTTPQQRGRYLTNLADLMEKHADTIAAIESLDNGKALGIAKMADVPNSYNCIRYYGGWADKIEGKVMDVNAETFAYTKQEPVSLVHLTFTVEPSHVDTCLTLLPL